MQDGTLAARQSSLLDLMKADFNFPAEGISVQGLSPNPGDVPDVGRRNKTCTQGFGGKQFSRKPHSPTTCTVLLDVI